MKLIAAIIGCFVTLCAFGSNPCLLVSLKFLGSWIGMTSTACDVISSLIQ